MRSAISRPVTPAASATSTATSARDSARAAADGRSMRPRSMATMTTSSNTSTAGTAHDGPRLNLAGSSSGTAIARTSVKAIGQRFSAPAPAATIPDTGPRGALPRLGPRRARGSEPWPERGVAGTKTFPSRGLPGGGRWTASRSRSKYFVICGGGGWRITSSACGTCSGPSRHLRSRAPAALALVTLAAVHWFHECWPYDHAACSRRHPGIASSAARVPAERRDPVTSSYVRVTGS